MTSVGIVGFGHVGRTLKRLFPDAQIYDKWLPEFEGSQSNINKTNICFVCVPTPRGDDGRADISAVDEVVGWLRSDLIVLRSTIPPGTTTRLREKYQKRIVCSPEYYGESTYRHEWGQDPFSWPFMVVGGPYPDTRPVVELFAGVLGPQKVYRQVEPEVAELAKYMENAWLATQVSFAWQFGLLADALAVDYWEVRELWALDPRISRWHTALFPEAPGFDGKCLPKDLAAITHAGRTAGCDVKLLEALLSFNHALRRRMLPNP